MSPLVEAHVKTARGSCASFEFVHAEGHRSPDLDGSADLDVLGAHWILVHQIIAGSLGLTVHACDANEDAQEQFLSQLVAAKPRCSGLRAPK